MQCKQVLLIFSVLITLAYSFPTGTEKNTIRLEQNESKILDAREEEKPLMLITEEKNPKSESVVVEFVYSNNDGNYIPESKGTDEDKYIVDSPVYKVTYDQTKVLNEKDKEKLTQELNTEKTAHGPENEQESDFSYKKKDFHLMPEEVSPLSGKLPKYFFDAFNPIQAFPELQYEKPNQINRQKVHERADAYLPYYKKERNEPINVAGPQLSPLSMYIREFDVPIFD